MSIFLSHSFTSKRKQKQEINTNFYLIFFNEKKELEINLIC